MREDQLENILVSGNYLSEKDFSKYQKIAKSQNVSISEYLLQSGIMTQDILGQAVAEFYHVPYADLNSNMPSREQAMKIPRDIAEKFRVVLFRDEENRVMIATDDPLQINLNEELTKLFPSKEILMAYSLSEDIDDALLYYQGPLGARIKKIISESLRVAPDAIDEILDDAIAHRASDIHFEPQEEGVLIRFRVDGVLGERGKIEKGLYENILNRIKVLSHLRIDEHFSAQDGAIRYASKHSGLIVDMRVSIAPMLDGEKVTMRLLSQYAKGLSFSDLGISDEHQKIIQEAAQKPFGMILAVGPTGSGKTTTLYSILKLLNDSEVNITTIEDPVEYRVVGVNQMQVNKQKDITFAKGLRSIVRQDPDIILVGEIRDNETAEIAINAALTGHLLLSTFHANDAASSIPRLLDMGSEPFLLASTLEILIAQRLVRRICGNCRYSYTAKSKELEKKFPGISRFFPEGDLTLYEGKGCDICGGSGYVGRTAIFEFIHMTPEMKDLIMKNPSSIHIWDLARSQGSKSMFDDGIEKVKIGVTSIEEVLRVVEMPKQ